ncbi:AI-2E family transporter [soil metagenome]
MPSDSSVPGPGGPDRRPKIPAWLDRSAAISWRVLLVAVVVLGVGYLLFLLRLVVLPVIGALFLATFLVPLASALRARRWPSMAAAWAVFGGFLGALVLIGVLVVPPLIDEFADLGPVISEGVDDVEGWLVDGPIGLEQSQLDEYREQAGERLGTFAESSAGSLISGAILVLEIFAGLILALVITFFLIKDGELFQQWGLRHVTERHRPLTRALAERGWYTLGRYLRGTAIIGLVEGTIIGIAVAVPAGALAAPVALLTFFAAFFQLVGAVVAGVIATLVVLVAAGPVPALIVAGVCLAVQQIDGDLLAPIVLGKAVAMHPLVILLVLTAGATLFGLVGAFLAVPVAAIAVQVTDEYRSHTGQPAARS